MIFVDYDRKAIDKVTKKCSSLAECNGYESDGYPCDTTDYYTNCAYCCNSDNCWAGTNIPTITFTGTLTFLRQ